MTFQAYAYTNKGGREHNEDYLDYLVSGDRGIWVLADGLGGHAYGEVASKAAAEAAIKRLRSVSLLSKESIEESIQSAHAAVLKEQSENKEYAAIRTTITVALSLEGELMWGNVGDSRLYYFRKGELFQVTPDHTVSYKAYLAGELEYQDIRFHS